MSGRQGLDGLLAELGDTDVARSAEFAEIDSLTSRVFALRARAGEVAHLLEVAPAERGRLEGALDEARGELGASLAALAAAEAELAAAGGTRDSERQAAAGRAVVRERDSVLLAERRAGAAEQAVRDHERKVEAAGEEASDLGAHGRELSRELSGRARVPAGLVDAAPSDLAALAAWASGVGAALLVARSAVAAERDQVIRQANELASMVLGEPIAAASVAVVLRRIEEAAG